ncbi:MAG: hypothetical protein JWN33_11 [Candidatus Saccharibacteria bacterium]|nr:hypothetical protein [Candidatus Saccharibacteria bacterium]
MTERIRFLTSDAGDSSLIFACDQVKGAFHEHWDEIETKLAMTNQTIEEVDIPADLSALHGECYEIKPPLTDNQVRTFARKFLTYANNGHNAVIVYDNRESRPTRHLETAGTVLTYL